jgi:hypothetical protein
MENHFTKSGEVIFFQLPASQFISDNHFTKSAEIIFRFGRASAEFNRESALVALPLRSERECEQSYVSSWNK